MRSGSSWMFAYLLALASFVTTSPNGDIYESYDGHQILSVHSTNRIKREALKADIPENCDVLKLPLDTSRPVDILCPPESLNSVKDHFSRNLYKFTVKVEDVGVNIRSEENLGSRRKRAANTRMDWNDFQRYETIISWMEDIARENPSFTQLIDMGRSVENRVLYALKIGKSPLGNETRAVWIDGGIHAREWISPTTATYLLDQLVKAFKEEPSDCKDKGVLSVDWYVAPLINPDGYEYTHTNQRYWRKNRSNAPSGSSCRGVDLNRNWNVVGFGAGATSNSPCSDVYKGPSKGSEPETRAIANTILEHKNNIRIYLTLHSYGSYWLTTWGYTKELPKDHEKQVTLARRGADAIKCVNPNRAYTIGSAGAIFYIAGGASDDWAKATAEIPYSSTIELPGTDFVISRSEIVPVGQELWAAVKEMAMEAARHPLGTDPAKP